MCEERGNLTPRKRAEITEGATERVTTGCGHLYVTVNNDNLGPCEVLIHLGKIGGCASSQLEAIGRLISISLRSGISGKDIVKQLRGIHCPSISWEGGKAVLSCADAIAMVLESQLGIEPEEGWSRSIVGQCPDCGGPLVNQKDCLRCFGCGYIKC